MMFKLAVIVFVASIVAFFADEFKRLFAKIFSIPGFKLLGPLFLASWLIYSFEEQSVWWLFWFKRGLHQVEQQLSMLLFHTGNIAGVRIVFLFLLASLPVWISWWLATRKRRFNPTHYSYYLGLILWIFASILLTVSG